MSILAGDWPGTLSKMELSWNMKLLRLTVAIFFSVILFVTNMAGANECKKSEEYTFLLCGDWTKPEIEELLSTLLGNEEIHKIIKQSENYYLLHTCEGRTEDSGCMGGLVYVFERNEGKLVVGSEMWEWVF